MSNKIKLMHPNVGNEELELVKEVIESGWLVEGPMVREFEKTVAEYVGVKYAIACSSATTGLELALRALGVGKGDEVIIPDFTHPATALVVMTVCAKPVLVDVNMDTRVTDAEKIEEAITDKTKAVIPVSEFGHPVDMDPINELKTKYDIHIIEDAACALGSEYKGKKVGSLADITVFSFHPRKIFTTGDGGLIMTDNDEWAELMNSMKKFGVGKLPDGKTGFIRWGTNYRMSNIHGAIALGQARRINEILNDRREKAKIYDKLLADVDGVRIPKIKSNCISNYQTYAIYLEKEGIRDEVMKEMRKMNTEVQIGTYALHTLPVFTDIKKGGNLENSYKLYRNLLTLPLHYDLTIADQERVIYELRQLLQK